MTTDNTSNSNTHDSFETLLSRPTVHVEEAGKILGIGRAAAYAAIHTGEIPSIKIGRRILVPTAHLKALLGL